MGLELEFELFGGVEGPGCEASPTRTPFIALLGRCSVAGFGAMKIALEALRSRSTFSGSPFDMNTA